MRPTPILTLSIARTSYPPSFVTYLVVVRRVLLLRVHPLYCGARHSQLRGGQRRVPTREEESVE